MTSYQHLQFFRSQGYLTVPGALAEPELARLLDDATRRDWSAEFVTADASGRRVRLESVESHIDVGGLLLRSRQLVDALEGVIGADWVLLLNRHNHITFDYGQGTRGARAHRDSLGWTRGYVTVVVMLRGGSLGDAWPSVIPGSHLWPVDAPRNGGGYWLDEGTHSESLRDQALKVPMAAGDVLLLDPQLFHAAGRGSDLEPRCVLTLALRAVDELLGEVTPNESLIRGSVQYSGQRSWSPRDDS